MKDNLEHGWVGTEDKYYGDEEPSFTCDWCGEDIYYGDEYYDLGNERVCATCIKNAKSFAV